MEKGIEFLPVSREDMIDRGWYYYDFLVVTADGYLYNMVRILAGTLCEAGAGRLAPEAVPGILASRDRKNAGPTLAAKGLFLKSVDYDTPIE